MEEMAEPSSPTAAAAASLHNEEFMLFDDDFASDFLIATNNDDDKLITFNTTTTTNGPRKSAEQLLLELEQEIKNEPTWLGGQTFVEPPASPILFDEKQPKNTDELLVEFETVCNAIGVTTPPQSPPRVSPAPQQSSSLEGVPIYYVVADDEVLKPENIFENSVLSSTESNESVDFIDELVRSHTSELPDLDYDFDDASSVSDSCSVHSDASSSQNSPQSDSGLSPQSDFSSFAGFSMEDEEEWTPKIVVEKSKAAKPEKRKKRPYGRPVEEKKVRKKEQNKNAATRYRQKKKQQLEEILKEEDGLKAVNMSLQGQYDDVKREINYLKKLMREILIAKGVQL